MCWHYQTSLAGFFAVNDEEIVLVIRRARRAHDGEGARKFVPPQPGTERAPCVSCCHMWCVLGQFLQATIILASDYHAVYPELCSGNPCFDVFLSFRARMSSLLV